MIAAAILERINASEGNEKFLTPAALRRLSERSWEAGNVRELQNTLRRAWAIADGHAIDAGDLMLDRAGTDADGDFRLPVLGAGFNLLEYEREFRIRVIRKAMAQCGGNVASAARLLGMSRQALHQSLRQAGMQA